MNGMIFEKKKGDYVHVGMYDKHRFYAVGCGVVLEIQYGDQCKEEDIVRL